MPEPSTLRRLLARLRCALIKHDAGGHMDPFPEKRWIDEETSLFEWKCLDCGQWIHSDEARP